MRYLYLLFALFTCFYQANATNADLIRSLQSEAEAITKIDQEIDYYECLIEKKRKISILFNNRRHKEILELFKQDEQILESYRLGKSLKEFKARYAEINHLYTNVKDLSSQRFPIGPRLEYYEACILTREKKLNPARKTLENILIYNLDPANRNAIVVLLEEIYFNLNRFDDVISVYPLYRGLNSEQQRWWLGQSLYHTEKYQQAQQVFKKLENSKVYGLRAKAAHALISYVQGDIKQAIKKFKYLKYKYSPDDICYNLINLSLARLYAIEGEERKAVLLYDQYVQLEDNIDDETLYEIALFFKSAGEAGQATEYFKKLLKSRFNLPAQYFLHIAEQDKGKSSGAEGLNSLIAGKKEQMQLLNTKFKILEEFSKIQDDVTQNELENIRIKYEANNEKISSLGSDLNIMHIQQLEDELLSFSSLISEYMAFVFELNNSDLIDDKKELIKQIYVDIDELSADLYEIKLSYINKVTNKIETLSENINYLENIRLELLFRDSVINDDSMGKKQLAYNEILNSIRENPDSEELDKLYFYLAELSCDIDQASPDKTATYYKQVIRYNRDFEYRDAVYYNIAYHTELAIVNPQSGDDSSSQNIDQVIYYYKKILEEHPNSTYFDEAAWRLAEVFFSMGLSSSQSDYFKEALGYYDLVCKDNLSTLQIQSLLGKIWVEFELAEYQVAMDSAINLINIMEKSESNIDSDPVYNEAIQIISWILINDSMIDFSEPSKALENLMQNLQTIDSEYWQKMVLYQVGLGLLENNYPEETEAYLNELLKEFPQCELSPKIDAAYIELFQQYPERFGGEQASKALIKKKQEHILARYNPESEWFELNEDKNIHAGVAEVIKIIELEENLKYDAFLNEQDIGKFNELHELSNMYFRLLSDFGESSSLKFQQMQERLVFCSQILAEQNPSLANLELAINTHQKFINIFPNHKEYLTYTRNIFLYSHMMTSQKNSSIIDTLFIDASKKYEYFLQQDDPELSKLLMKRAEYLYSLNEYESAQEDYFKLTSLNSPTSLKVLSFRRLAEISMLIDDYNMAEYYYREAFNLAEGYEKEEIYSNIVTVLSQKAEKLVKVERQYSAALQYMNLARELKYTKTEQCIAFYYRALELFEETEEIGNLPAQIHRTINELHNDLYIETQSELDNMLNDIQTNFLNKSPEDLLPITSATRWKEHFTDGDNGFKSLRNRCDQYKQDIFIQLENSPNLAAIAYSRALYYAAAIYDHAYLVADKQVDKYIAISSQLQSEKTTADSINLILLKERIKTEGESIAKSFMLEAVTIYQNIIYNFYEDRGYTDLWVNKSLYKLIQWGIRNETGEARTIDNTELISDESLANDKIKQEFNTIYKKFEMEDYINAQTDFKEFIEKYPGHKLTYDALYYLGECYYNSGDLETALTIFNQVLEYENGKTPDALIRIGHYYNKIGEREKALEYWEKLITNYPESNLSLIIKMTINKLKKEVQSNDK